MENTNDKNKQPYEAFLDENVHDLYENAPCGYFSSLPDGTIVKVNQTLLNWLDCQRNQILHVKKFPDLLMIGGKIFYETHHAPLLQMQGFINEINYDIVRKDGTLLPVLMNSVQVKNAQGEVLFNRSTLFNITDRKKYERELLNAKKKAEQATKVKSEFLSTVSHEIRTPMNAIIGITNLLLKTELNSKQLEFVNTLKFSSENLLNLINDILDFNKIESGKIRLEEKSFNLKSLVYSIIHNLNVKAEEKNLPIRVHIDTHLPEYFIGDPVKISQILTNLLGNATKFTDRGEIAVNIHAKKIGDSDASFECIVKDTGIGIHPDKLNLIFEEFSQASYEINTQYGGTGLGLAISQKLLELHGSKMNVESELGKGSSFYFTLTLRLDKEKKMPTEELEEITDEKNGLKGVKLLLAEDNRINILVMSEFLNYWGVEFDVAENGKVVIEKVLENTYDMVLMDLQMPVMDGYEAARKINNLVDEKYQKLPIIALSASAKIDIQEKIASAGIKDFVSKPFDPKALFNKIAFYSSPRAKGHTPESSPLSANDKPLTATDSYNEPISINLNQFIKLTKNRNDKLASLIHMTVEDFIHYKTNFKMAIEQGDKQEFEFLAHKSKMSINLLEANKLDVLLNRCKKLMEEEETSLRSGIIGDIEDEFEKIIVALQKHKNSLY